MTRPISPSSTNAISDALAGREDYPSERASRAALQMEIHAALRTTTRAKAVALDCVFPAYDELLAALKDLISRHAGADETTLVKAVGMGQMLAIRHARAAIDKAEGRASQAESEGRGHG